MQQMDPPPVVLSRRGPPRLRRDRAAPTTDLERALSNHQEVTREEIERGVRAMYRAAVRLMRQVASEAWAAGGPEAEERFRDGILQTLARDHAFRAVLGQVEERQQTLGLRLERIETALRNLIRANREAVTRDPAQASELAGELSALHSELHAGMASVRRAVIGPSAERIVEEAAARGTERAVRSEVSRVEAAVGRLRSLEDALAAFPRLAQAPVTGSAPAGAPGADQRLRDLQRRLAWSSARLAARGNGGPAP